MTKHLTAANFYIKKMYDEYVECVSRGRIPDIDQVKAWAGRLENAFVYAQDDEKELGKTICSFFGNADSYRREYLEIINQIINTWNGYLAYETGFSVSSPTEVYIQNLLNSTLAKKALISYIVHPFMMAAIANTHTNQKEVMYIAEILDELGYQVDVIDFRYSKDIPESSDYDLIFGFGKKLECIAESAGNTTKKIYYTTGANPYVANMNELARIRGFAGRHNGTRMPYDCLVTDIPDLRKLQIFDAAIVLGNDWTESTYDGVFKKTYRQNATGFQLSGCPNTDMEIRKHTFICYGNYAAIHKGLDLCIEAFSELPEFELYIIGNVDTHILDYYKDTVASSPNIHMTGFLSNNDERFLSICGKSAFCLNPSCSEGQATSVLTMMMAGIIPICTKETGIDFEESGAIEIKDCSVAGIKAIVKNVSAIDNLKIHEMSDFVYNYATHTHSEMAYKEMMRHNILQIIDSCIHSSKNPI